MGFHWDDRSTDHEDELWCTEVATARGRRWDCYEEKRRPAANAAIAKEEKESARPALAVRELVSKRARSLFATRPASAVLGGAREAISAAPHGWQYTRAGEGLRPFDPRKIPRLRATLRPVPPSARTPVLSSESIPFLGTADSPSPPSRGPHDRQISPAP